MTHDNTTVAGGVYTRDSDEDSLRYMRRVNDQAMRDEIHMLRERNSEYADIINELKSEQRMLRKDFDDYVEQSKSALSAATGVADAKRFGRNALYFTVAITGAFGGIVAVIDWFSKK